MPPCLPLGPPTPPSDVTATVDEPSGTSTGLGLSRAARAAFFFAGVVLPVICFLISFPEGPTWQSGTFGAYAQLLLARRPSVPIYPLLFYNMVSMSLVLFAPERYVRYFVVRFGIYSGVLLALQYWVIFQLTMVADRVEDPLAALPFLFCMGVLSLIAVSVPPLIGKLARALAKKVWWPGLATLLLALALLPPICFYVAAVILWCSTPWALASYAAVSVYVARRGGSERCRFSLAQLLAVFAWWAAYLGAWRTSFLLMLEEYAALPETPPQGCYVASAAARGHRRVVGSRGYRLPDGSICPVNDQLRYLKAFELLLAAASPELHRMCRWVYNRLGPRLASLLVHPLAADVAYVSLKPAEWLARATLAVFVPGQKQRIRRLYSSCHTGRNRLG
jgi:hypothetical protein